VKKTQLSVNNKQQSVVPAMQAIETWTDRSKTSMRSSGDSPVAHQLLCRNYLFLKSSAGGNRGEVEEAEFSW
jgi:hypothetical protein